MESTQLNDPVTLDDLINAYLRFKEWMDYDTERSAYCAKEIIVLQKLFGIPYVTVPRQLADASYEDLLSIMEDRLDLIVAHNGAIDDTLYNDDFDDEDRQEIDDLMREIDKTSFRSTVHYFKTLHQAINEAAQSVVIIDPSDPESYTIDTEPFDDCFAEASDTLIDQIREFILSEHPRLESMSFPLERAYSLGLPRKAPEPIDHGPTALN
jgi:hypothetical protein